MGFPAVLKPGETFSFFEKNYNHSKNIIGAGLIFSIF